MTRIESSILVPKTVEDTFTFLNTRESHLKFIPRCVEFTQTSDGMFGKVGARVQGAVRYFGIRIPIDYEIIEHQMNQRLVMKGRMGLVHFKDGYILSGKANGTKIKFWLKLYPMGWAKVFLPFAGLIGKIHAWETMKNLKRELAIWHPSTNGEIVSSPHSPFKARGSSQ